MQAGGGRRKQNCGSKAGSIRDRRKAETLLSTPVQPANCGERSSRARTVVATASALADAARHLTS